MSLIKLRVKNIKNLGLWNRVCEYRNWNNWTPIDDEEVVEFDDRFVKDEVVARLNKANMYGVVTLSSNDSPNDFEELFQQFIDKYNWNWKGKFNWH